jgi:hypothetical protein
VYGVVMILLRLIGMYETRRLVKEMPEVLAPKIVEVLAPKIVEVLAPKIVEVAIKKCSDDHANCPLRKK